MKPVRPAEYQSLAELRHVIRRFLAFSEEAARKYGLEPKQHQLLLAVKGLPDGARPTVGTIAERLVVKHHSAVELVARCEAMGLVARERSAEDRREVLVRVTPKGEELLEALTRAHRAELRVAGPQLVGALRELLGSELE